MTEQCQERRYLVLIKLQNPLCFALKCHPRAPRVRLPFIVHPLHCRFNSAAFVRPPRTTTPPQHRLPPTAVPPQIPVAFRSQSNSDSYAPRHWLVHAVWIFALDAYDQISYMTWLPPIGCYHDSEITIMGRQILFPAIDTINK